MRLRYFLDRFQVRTSIGEGENLAGPVRPFGLQGHPVVTEDGPRNMTTLEPHANRGGTPSSKISSRSTPSPVSMRRTSSWEACS
jgi:hypothetical protein